MLSWWGFVAGIIYLQRGNPSLYLTELIVQKILPALSTIIPSILILIVPAILVSAYFGFLTARWIDLRLANLREAVQYWQRGDFSVKVSDQTADEISTFGQELNTMARDLEHLLQARADLAALEERTHLARDLHDSVKQQITAASFQVGSASALLEQDQNAARSSLQEAENLIHAAHQELNSILLELRPVQMKAGGLVRALQEYTQTWQRQNDIQVVLESQGKTKLPPGLQQEIFRFFQEALSNVARHSQASEVQVGLIFDDLELNLSIEDNGCGFDPNSVTTQGFGLKTMRERITRVGGSLTLTSRPGGGTRLAARVPIPVTRREQTNAS